MKNFCYPFWYLVMLVTLTLQCFEYISFHFFKRYPWMYPCIHKNIHELPFISDNYASLFQQRSECLNEWMSEWVFFTGCSKNFCAFIPANPNYFSVVKVPCMWTGKSFYKLSREQKATFNVAPNNLIIITQNICS